MMICWQNSNTNRWNLQLKCCMVSFMHGTFWQVGGWSRCLKSTSSAISVVAHVCTATIIPVYLSALQTFSEQPRWKYSVQNARKVCLNLQILLNFPDKCPDQDIYFPRSKYQGNIDGAYFGTTFPHLFLMTYGYLKPQKSSVTYSPRIFGFKVRFFIPTLVNFPQEVLSPLQIRDPNQVVLPVADRTASSEPWEWAGHVIIPDFSCAPSAIWGWPKLYLHTIKKTKKSFIIITLSSWLSRCPRAQRPLSILTARRTELLCGGQRTSSASGPGLR